MSSLISVDERDGYAVVALNRPEKRNAVNIALADEFVATLQRLEETPVIVVTGSEKSFCAGIDLKERGNTRDWNTSLGAARGQFWFDTLEVMRRHPAVFIAAVNGYAFGGGLTLVNNAELAVAAESAQFSMPELGFGHFPALSGPTTTKRILPKHAAEMIFRASRFDAATAFRWGLVNEVVPDDDLLPAARRLAEEIAAKDKYVLGFAKRAVRELAEMEWSNAIDYGTQIGALVLNTRNAHEPDDG